ncbi:hypothetical protein TNCV_3887701 [Trichonephila clavipes]|nr:hypothetical protein TNCV_3887701 [Trichonephila clavipes]
MPLDNKCRIGPLAGAPPDTCAVVISTETESGFITEDDTSQSVTLQVARGRKNPVDTAYDVGSVVSVLADVGSSSQSVSRLLMVSLDGTGCLEGVRQLLVCRRLRLRGILSLNIVYQSHQIRLDSRTALVLMLLNSPSCATNMRIAHLALSHWLRNFNHLHISYQTTFLPMIVA